MPNDDRRLIEDYLPIEASRANSPSSDEEGWRSERRGGAERRGAERSVTHPNHASNPHQASR